MARRFQGSRRELHSDRPPGSARGLFKRVATKLRRARHLPKHGPKADRKAAWAKKKRPLHRPKDPSDPQSYLLGGDRKVHAPADGVFPDHVPRHWTRDQIEEVTKHMRTSVATRRQEALQLSEDGPHREQLRRQEDFLRLLEKALSGT